MPAEGVSHWVQASFHMPNVSGVLSNGGQVALLVSTNWLGDIGDGHDQWLVVCEDGERPDFKDALKGPDGFVYG